jgi:DNA modification methylase
MRTDIQILQGDALATLRTLPDQSINCCVTSPPYWGLRDYGVRGQLGLEATPEEYVVHIVEVFREVRRVLRDDGTLWCNLGDSYAASTKGSGGHNPKQDSNAGSWHDARRWRIPGGLKPKDLVGIPWRVAFALQADGWYLRSDIIWHKPNPMPESVTDRPTKAHEYLFLLAKSARYYYDADAIAEPATCFGRQHTTGVQPPKEIALQRDGTHGIGGDLSINYERTTRNRRTVWTVATKPFKGAHFAAFPPKLIEPCILAGCPKGGTVLDPFAGAGTTGLVSKQHGRRFIGIELNPQYAAMARARAA